MVDGVIMPQAQLGGLRLWVLVKAGSMGKVGWSRDEATTDILGSL